jgi:NAD(P)-dependent dehydrogenase (short-subunit alcohol dehydrogenase family)
MFQIHKSRESRVFKNLQSDGLIGPFELNQDEMVVRLIRQLDIADGQFKNFYLNSETCKRLLSSPELRGKIAQNFGKDLLLWRTNNFKKTDGSGEVEWHHDRHFEDGDSLVNFSNIGNHFSILVALTDMDDESGVMEFIPGSHLEQDGYVRDDRPYHLRPPEEHFFQVPDHMLAKRVKVPLKRGQFMLFYSGLLHRSLPAYGKGVHRYSLVARLCHDLTNIPEVLAKKEEISHYPYMYDTNKRFLDQVALITGGSKGIGKAIAAGLLAEGARVVITGRNKQALDEATELLKLKTGNQQVVSMVADASDLEQMQLVFNDLIELYGSPDIVFVNAATNKPTGAIINLPADDWLSMVTSNIKSTYLSCKFAVSHMKKHGGNIVTLGSGIGHHGAPNNSAYAVSKAASWALTQSLAKEVSNLNINVNELIPGPVITDMNPSASGPAWKKPDDVVETALNLANQHLQHGATGQSWAIKRH